MLAFPNVRPVVLPIAAVAAFLAACMGPVQPGGSPPDSGMSGSPPDSGMSGSPPDAGVSVSVVVVPHTTTLTPGQAATFSATVTGSSDQAVTWKVVEGSAGGTVTSAGAYAAPSAAGTYHLMATSHADPAASDTATISVGTAAGPTWIWGVTTDDPTVNTAQQVDALRSFPKRVTVRTVFDPPSGGGPVAADYVASVTQISAVADVMGLPVDSSAMSGFTLAAIKSRISEYLGALGNVVSVWEIGNEINGNWLGNNVMPKLEAMYDAVEAAGKPTALTLYYENPPTPGYDMIPWVDANIPPGHRMRSGLEYVLVSYYEDQNGGHQLTQAEIDGMFAALASRFPNANLGFGEFGWGKSIPPSPGGDATRAALIQRFYGYRVPSVPRFVGGSFYWHFRQTMVAKTKPDWNVLQTLISAG